MARPLRVLFAGLTLPYPPTNGHRLRTWAMVQALADDGHRVTLVAFAERGEALVDLGPLRAACAEVELVPTPLALNGGGRDALKRVRALASPLPFGAWKFRSPELRGALERQLARHDFDVLLCDGVYNMQNLPAHLAIPVLLNKDDVAHVLIRRYLALEPSAARRLYGALEARKVERWERAALQQAKAVLACSELDKALLRELAPTAQVVAVPNVVDTDHYAPRDGAEPATVLFQGGMDWQPNRDAVEFFAAEILPWLRRRVPAARFRVAGRSPAESFRRRFAGIDGLEFTGTVADMRDEIAKATVCVVPLRIGSGTRLKILEAGAMAKPMVSTGLGAEGLELVDGEEIVLADEPRAFADAVAALLHDVAGRDELGRGARLRVEKQYSLSVFKTALRDAVTGSLR